MILTEFPDLEDYFRAKVIGGDSAFALPVQGFEGISEGMRHKLSVEIASAAPPHIGPRLSNDLPFGHRQAGERAPQRRLPARAGLSEDGAELTADRELGRAALRGNLVQPGAGG